MSLRFSAVLSALVVANVFALGCGTTPTALPSATDFPETSRFGPQTPLVAPEKGADFPEWGAGQPRRHGSAQGGIFDLAYGFYSNYLTEIDGPRCEHRPTCSRYAHLAMQKHGALLGSWMAVDRLMRTTRSSSLRRLPIYKIEDGKVYFLDPVDGNDFFL